MKRNLLKTLFAGLFLSMLAPLTASADEILINDANFPDANFRNYLLGQYYGWDGKITDEEIAGITIIMVPNKNISSLQGIEYFTALTSLYCHSNQLTSLDVSGCTALTYLGCHENQLTSLDVSQNTVLTELSCSFNQLTSLDVSQNTALAELDCSWNQLNSLDVSGCTALTYLVCCTNQLTSLGVSGCTALTELYCYENQLTSLDVSGCTALAELVCYENQLTSLDVSGCAALTYLSCGGDGDQLTSLDVSGCTALTYLDCGSNQLTFLDVSQNTALTTLGCWDNQLTFLDVSQNMALTRLVCWGNQLTSLDVSQNTALTSLSCGQNQLTSLDVSQNTALTSLSCSYNQLASLDVSQNTALTSLECGFNQLTSLDVSGCTALTSLSCSSNQLASLDVSQNTALTELYCHYNQLKGISMDAFIESLSINTSNTDHNLYIHTGGSNEGNVCTRSQVAAIKAKGWTPYYYGYINGVWHGEYEGCDEPTTETISIGANGIATYCSPFDLNFAEVDGLKAYIASGYDQAIGTVLLTRVTKVPAGTGIMLMGNEGVYSVSIQPTQYYYVNMLKGTLTAQALPQEEGGYTNYILTNGKEGVMFYMSSGNGNIAANRAYLQVPTASSPAGVRSVLNYVVDDNETTGIEQPQAMQQDGDAVYNLNGQRVEQPRKGLYIKNGKKIFIR